MAAPKKTRRPRTPKTESDTARESTSFIERQQTRLSKLDKLLAALDKDAARAPSAGWGADLRSALAATRASVGSTASAIAKAPEGFEPARVSRTAMNPGDFVQLAEKFRPEYAFAFEGIRYGTTAIGVITAVDTGGKTPRMVVTFGGGDHGPQFKTLVPPKRLVVVPQQAVLPIDTSVSPSPEN